jgi:uncharacterized membrane protein (UPF0127 family)
MMLVNRDNGEVLADQVGQAFTFAKRLKGLMLTENLPSGNALHIRPCRSVHTYFMKYPIDVLHLDESQRIVGIERELSPKKIGQAFKGTVSVVELPAGTVEQKQTKVGQAVLFQNQN